MIIDSGVRRLLFLTVESRTVLIAFGVLYGILGRSDLGSASFVCFASAVSS